ncbi:MAG: hypothetical protein MI741_02600, partial [Rhodospirillales bacterium]|nr:hypothetical protein [Rhodospirillales bacterium]
MMPPLRQLVPALVVSVAAHGLLAWYVFGALPPRAAEAVEHDAILVALASPNAASPRLESDALAPRQAAPPPKPVGLPHAFQVERHRAAWFAPAIEPPPLSAVAQVRDHSREQKRQTFALPVQTDVVDHSQPTELDAAVIPVAEAPPVSP